MRNDLLILDFLLVSACFVISLIDIIIGSVAVDQNTCIQVQTSISLPIQLLYNSVIYLCYVVPFVTLMCLDLMEKRTMKKIMIGRSCVWIVFAVVLFSELFTTDCSDLRILLCSAATLVFYSLSSIVSFQIISQ